MPLPDVEDGAGMPDLPERLKRDPRRRDMQIARYGQVEQRGFAAWRVGLANFADNDSIQEIMTRERGNELVALRLLAERGACSE